MYSTLNNGKWENFLHSQNAIRYIKKMLKTNEIEFGKSERSTPTSMTHFIKRVC